MIRLGRKCCCDQINGSEKTEFWKFLLCNKMCHDKKYKFCTTSSAPEIKDWRGHNLHKLNSC